MKYAVWNKRDPIITPSGSVFTAEQWIERYPVAGLEHITVVCSAGEINGAFFGTIGQLVDNYTEMGCDFSGCTTAEEKLATIEAFEAEQAAIVAGTMSNEGLTAASLASIAASLEYQNMMTLEDVTV